MNYTVAYKTLGDMTRPKTLLPYAMRVAKWNQVAILARRGKSTDIDLQVSFIKEEFRELCAALETNDRVEVVDAACDLFVVASYAMLLQAGKGSHFDSLLNYRLGFNFGNLSYNLYARPVTTSSLADILADVVALCFDLDTNLVYNLEQVLSSNDSKYPYLKDVVAIHNSEGVHRSEKEALRLECMAIEERSKSRPEGAYTGVHPVVVDEILTDGASDLSGPRVVFFDAKGKIMKPGTFVEPKIIV